jgi:hypothetical protein
VLYRETHALLDDLAEATLDGTRKEHMEFLVTVPLLILDDLGMRKLPLTAAEELLEIIMRRYERASTMLTSNRPVEDWGKLLGDAAAVSAMLDPSPPRACAQMWPAKLAHQDVRWRLNPVIRQWTPALSNARAAAKSAVGMTAGGRRWKTLVSPLKAFRRDIEFPTVAHRPWKSPTTRFPHSHSADEFPSLLSFKYKHTARPSGSPGWNGDSAWRSAARLEKAIAGPAIGAV